MPPADEEVAMSNGARHGVGVLIGLIVTPLVAACLFYGGFRMMMYMRYVLGHGSDRWTGAAVLLLAAVLIGLVSGTRVSPVASLIPGAAFTAVGLLWVAAPQWSAAHTLRKLPEKLDIGYQTLGPYGIMLVLGVALIVASVAPSRWRARTAAAGAPRYAGPPPAPMGPPPGAPGAPGAPALPAPQGPSRNAPWGAPPQYGQQPPAQPQYGQPGPSGAPRTPSASPSPAAPQSPSAPQSPPAQRPVSGAVPFDDGGKPSAQGGSADEGVGEWTQMYGGDDLRGNDR